MGIKKSYQKLLVLFICGLLVFSVQASAACTAVYVGSDVSADGSTILAGQMTIRKFGQAISQ